MNFHDLTLGDSRKGARGADAKGKGDAGKDKGKGQAKDTKAAKGGVNLIVSLLDIDLDYLSKFGDLTPFFFIIEYQALVEQGRVGQMRRRTHSPTGWEMVLHLYRM